MLTEGAKPGTPHITPRKIYPDGIDLFIEVKSSSSLLIVACKIINILRKIYISLQSITLTFSPSSLRFPDNFTPRNAQCFWQWASKIACPQKFFFYAFNFGTKFCNRRRRGCKRLQIAKQKVHFLLMREFSPFVLVTSETVSLLQFFHCFFLQDFHIRSHRQRCSFALRDSRWINKIETINNTLYLLILDLEIGFTLCSICFLGWDKRNQQNMAARGLPKKLQTWFGFLYDNDDDDDDIDD